jgi:DNA-binding transcriptional MerR regulator
MRIGELAAATGTTTKSLRFYEQAGLLPPPARTPGGYRDYTEDAVARLDFVRRGQRAGLTLAQIREILSIRDAGRVPCHHVEQVLAERLAGLDRQIAELVGLRATVARLHQEASHPEPGRCDSNDVCRYL